MDPDASKTNMVASSANAGQQRKVSGTMVLNRFEILKIFNL
jgi:hypothetical protein